MYKRLIAKHPNSIQTLYARLQTKKQSNNNNVNESEEICKDGIHKLELETQKNVKIPNRGQLK